MSINHINKAYNNINKSKKYKYWFIELDQMITDKQSELISRLNDTRNYRERISARIINNDIHVGISSANLLVSVQGLFVGTVDVGLVVTDAERDHIADLAQTQLIGIGRAAEVRDQGEEVRVRMTGKDCPSDIGGVCHLGDGLGADKGSEFHVLHAGSQQLLNDLDFLLCGDLGTFDALEAVARTDFTDLNGSRHGYSPLR